MHMSRMGRRLMGAVVLAALLLGSVRPGAADPLRDAPPDSLRTAPAMDSSRVVRAMDTVRLPRTKAASGRRVGMIVGGIAGITGGALLGILIQALSESEGDTDFGSASDWIGWMSAWTLTGLGSGALVGTIIGSTIPAGERAVPAAAPPAADSTGGVPAVAPVPTGSAGRRPHGPVGSLTPLLVGGALPGDPWGDRHGLGGRLELQAHRGAGYRVGLEYTRLEMRPRVTSVGFSAAVRLAPHWHVLVGLGNDHWGNGLNLLGGDLGVEWSASDYRAMGAWVVEARVHGTLQRFDEYYGGEKFVSLGVGRRFGW